LPARTNLAAVCARILVVAGGATARLLAADGAILDHLYCPPRMTPYDLALFAPPALLATLRIGPVGPRSEARVLSARLVSFAAETLNPARLVPQRDLAATADWPQDPYGAPGPEDAAGRLRDLVFSGLTRTVPVPWLHDLQFTLEPGDEQSCCLMKFGLYEPEGLFAVDSRLSPGDVFVDVGANCGVYTLFAARAVGPSGIVVAFEPSAREFARLAANVALNRLAQVRLHRAAASDAPGNVRLAIAEPPFAGHNTMAERFAYASVRRHGVEEVRAVALDEALADLPRLAMIKLDIEGAELRALSGAEATLARFSPALLLEIYGDALAANGTSVLALVSWLVAHGYRLYDIDRRTGAIAPAAGFPPGVNRNVLALPAGDAA
jgi:FkbM family methyltransferase